MIGGLQAAALQSQIRNTACETHGARNKSEGRVLEDWLQAEREVILWKPMNNAGPQTTKNASAIPAARRHETCQCAYRSWLTENKPFDCMQARMATNPQIVHP